jgi:hypothetical protein
MANDPEFDLSKAHRYFAATCFNKTWDLIEKSNRTAADDEQMVLLTLASMWHWTERADCKQENLSIGYWQASRVYAILRRVEEARRYANLCRENSPEEMPFLAAYAHEALARAESAAGNQAATQKYLAEAHRLADKIADAQDREQLLNDLKTITS